MNAINMIKYNKIQNVRLYLYFFCYLAFDYI